ncbi:hypothetical protein FOZ62_017262 [Perkinsus olseni]|uniref:Peptidase A1 domain-containing protein n=1 Tax=Perkinsus olseni TaxID=32597 RepID=A0A7J6QEP7_PEROL|nr:hypothetical protein FOZ62_017262 [Perkinsus olseni]
MHLPPRIVKIFYITFAVLLYPSSSLTIPVENGFVTVKVDGQEMKLLLDSGSEKFLVNDGVWYEEKYGKGACKDPRAACYFCSRTAACFAPTSAVYNASFADGDVVEYVIHSGSVTLGDRTVEGIEFGIVINSIRPAHRSNVTETSVLGIATSCGRGFSKSLVEQLRSTGTIRQTSFSIYSRPSASLGIDGEVTFGSRTEEGLGMKMTRLEYCYQNRLNRVSVWISGVGMYGPQERLLPSVHQSARLPWDRSYLGYVDSGSYSLHIPHAEDLIGDILGLAKRRLIAQSRRFEEAAIIRRTRNGHWLVKEGLLAHLPTLAFRINSAGDILVKIPPRDYTRCARGKCLLKIVEGKPGDRVLLGVPLLRAYDVHVNFDTRVVGFRSPAFMVDS